jgi:hypothetical protein
MSHMNMIVGEEYIYIGDSPNVEKDARYRYDSYGSATIGAFTNMKTGSGARIKYKNAKPVRDINNQSMSKLLYRERKT